MTTESISTINYTNAYRNKSNNVYSVTNKYNDCTGNICNSSISSGHTGTTNTITFPSITISSIDLYNIILDFTPMCLNLETMLYTDSNGTVTPISDMSHISK